MLLWNHRGMKTRVERGVEARVEARVRARKAAYNGSFPRPITEGNAEGYAYNGCSACLNAYNGGYARLDAEEETEESAL
jgi:hypothetical protein